MRKYHYMHACIEIICEIPNNANCIGPRIYIEFYSTIPQTRLHEYPTILKVSFARTFIKYSSNHPTNAFRPKNGVLREIKNIFISSCSITNLPPGDSTAARKMQYTNSISLPLPSLFTLACRPPVVRPQVFMW